MKFQTTRRLFVAKGNLAKQRCHLHFNHRCKNENILPKSLCIRPPVRSKKGFELARRHGFAFLSLRITENHAMIIKYQRKVQKHEEILGSSFNDRLWRRVKRELQHYFEQVTSDTRSKHDFRLDTLRKDDSAKTSKMNKTKWVINMSSRQLTESETSLLSKGLNFAPAPRKIPSQQIINEVESSLYNLDPVKRSEVRNPVVGVLSSAKPPMNNLTRDEMGAVKTLKNNKNIIILRADKGNATVVMNKKEYHDKMTTLLKQDLSTPTS